VKAIRYLAALAPLVAGVALSGCGGILGSVEGTQAPAAAVTFGGVVATPGVATRVVLNNASGPVTSVVQPAPCTTVQSVSVVSNTNPAVVAVTTSGAAVTVTPQALGDATVTIRVILQQIVRSRQVLDQGFQTVDIVLNFHVKHPQAHAQGGGTN
jgi:hypothetical protein